MFYKNIKLLSIHIFGDQLLNWFKTLGVKC